MECVGVSNVIYEHNEVCLSEEFESDFFEDVLTCNIYQVELYAVIGFALNGDLLHIVLTALGHHVVVVEALLADLVHQASLTDCWLSC